MKEPDDRPRRPPFQFSLISLFVLTSAIAAAAAPGFYMMRGQGGMPQAPLIGMLMLLAGPLLLMTIVSLFVSLMGRKD
jgi:hypothetical protein